MGTAAKTLLSPDIEGKRLVEQAEFYRLDAGRFLTAESRAELGQFLTPSTVAHLIAGLSAPSVRDIRLLDPRAGGGRRPCRSYMSTTFLDRSAMIRYLGDISWETEVWVADAPSHMIHFNGVRFLGPYET